MSTAIWPPIARDALAAQESASTARELAWLLSSLRETLLSLKSGLSECIALIDPTEPGSTLVVSSPRTDSLKGIVTRVGTRVTRGDIQLRLSTLPPPPRQSSYRLVIPSSSSTSSQQSIVLPQLVTVRNRINDSLDVIDVSLWTGDATNASFIAGQLRLLSAHVSEARNTLKGADPATTSGAWWRDPVAPSLFDPPLPKDLSFHLFISEASLHLHVRTLVSVSNPPPSSSLTGFDFRGRLALAVGAAQKPQTHDEEEETFVYRGEEVRVREKVRVESGDPSLMAIMAKLAALEHACEVAKRSLAIVMGEEE